MQFSTASLLSVSAVGTMRTYVRAGATQIMQRITDALNGDDGAVTANEKHARRRFHSPTIRRQNRRSQTEPVPTDS